MLIQSYCCLFCVCYGSQDSMRLSSWVFFGGGRMYTFLVQPEPYVVLMAKLYLESCRQAGLWLVYPTLRSLLRQTVRQGLTLLLFKKTSCCSVWSSCIKGCFSAPGISYWLCLNDRRVRQSLTASSRPESARRRTLQLLANIYIYIDRYVYAYLYIRIHVCMYV